MLGDLLVVEGNVSRLLRFRLDHLALV